MTTVQKTIPTWILILSGIFALMEIGVSIALCVSPQDILETVDLSANGVEYLIYMWAGRQFALGIAFGFATIRKSVPMLTLAYLFFFFMFICDTCVGISQKETTLVITGLVMCVVSLFMLWAINRKP